MERTNSKYPNRVICPSICRLSNTDNRRLEDFPDSQSLKNLKKLLWDSVVNAYEMQVGVAGVAVVVVLDGVTACGVEVEGVANGSFCESHSWLK